ncbi:MAG: efflux RND transporter permease subunit [Desulfosalsimonas sp.]|uniref:efflux RND transporter permease subunit n=1 Tax=Desulfosalsimonas sp. TaxID=3073848 RepID=UPI003970C72F
MSRVEAYLKNPHGITALLFLGVVFGLISFRTLPLNLFPDANYPQVAVLLVWPGASAEDMTDRVSRQVEKELAGIAQVRRVEATVRDETAAVRAEFEYEKGLDAAVPDVSAALNRILPSLPADMLPPRIFRVSDATAPVLTLAVSPGTGSHLSMARVRQLADNEIQEALLRLDSVADAEVFGGYKPEIRVSVDRDKLAGYDLSITQVLAAVSQQHKNTPSGTLFRDQDRVLIKIEGEKKHAEQLGEVVVATGKKGRVYLRDLAEIKTTHQTLDSFFHGNGKAAIGINILRAEGGHVTDTLESVEAALPQIKKQFAQLSLEVADTQGELIRTSVGNLVTSLRDAVILTVCVIFLFLARVRITLLAAVSIPVTFLLTFAGMKLIGYELNIVTLTAVILAVGLLVDDAIVVIENIDSHNAPADKTRLRAAIDGTKEIFLADFAGTVTTISVLLPIMFVGGYSEKILRPLTVVLSLALASSFIASVTVIPLFARRLLKTGNTPNRLEQGLQRVRDAILAPLQQFMLWAFRAGTTRWFFLVAPLLIAALIAGLRQMPLAGRDLMPPMDTGILKVSFETWPNMSMDRTRQVVKQMEQVITGTPGYVRMSTAVGAEPSVISFGSDQTPQEGLMTVHFKNRFERPETLWEIEADLRQAFAQIPGLKTVHVFDYGATPLSAIAAPVDVRISGPDPQILDQLADKVKQRLGQVKGLKSISRTWDFSKPELIIALNQEKLTEYGISQQDTADFLNAATSGKQAALFRVPGQDGYPIQIRLNPEQVDAVGALSTLQVPAPNGPIPLAEIAEIRTDWKQTRITREDLQPTVDVIAYRAKAPISFLHGQVQEAVADIDLPGGYSIEHTGEISFMEESFARLGGSLGMALVLLYFVLVVTFRSWAHPVMIMSAIPLAFIGVPWGMLMAGRHFCMPAAMGMILLSGIVVNNSILLIDYIENARKKGTELMTAVEDGIRRRTRPILMTALSTIAGMTPIAAELAVGLERLSPLAVVAISGLAVSTLLTLIYVPVIYVWISRARIRLLGN